MFSTHTFGSHILFTYGTFHLGHRDAGLPCCHREPLGETNGRRRLKASGTPLSGGFGVPVSRIIFFWSFLRLYLGFPFYGLMGQHLLAELATWLLGDDEASFLPLRIPCVFFVGQFFLVNFFGYCR